MNNIHQHLGSYTIATKPPYKKYSRHWRQTKSKVGKKMIKISRFEGWGEWLEDGQIVKDDLNKILYMNKTTENQLKKAIECGNY